MDSTQNPKWGIKSFAEMFDVTPRTIRFYEDKGLLSPTRTNGVRVFGLQDRLRFEKIMLGKRVGFSLEDIRSVFDITDGTVSDRSEILRRKANFEAVVSGLAKRRRDLDTLHADMTNVINIADEALNVSTQTDDVADLASRYQAAFETMTTGNAIDFQPGQTPDTLSKPNLTPL